MTMISYYSSFTDFLLNLFHEFHEIFFSLIPLFVPFHGSLPAFPPFLLSLDIIFYISP